MSLYDIQTLAMLSCMLWTKSIAQIVNQPPASPRPEKENIPPNVSIIVLKKLKNKKNVGNYFVLNVEYLGQYKIVSLEFSNFKYYKKYVGLILCFFFFILKPCIIA